MLKQLKNKDKKAKKQSKKDAKDKKEVKQQIKDDEELQQSTDLVGKEQLLQDQSTTTKHVTRNKKEFQLEEKQIDTSKFEVHEKTKVMTTWVCSTVEETKGKFTINQNEFASLTDHKLNEQLKKKQQQAQKTNEPKIQVSNGIMFSNIQMSADQLKMERAEQAMNFKSGNSQQSSSISFPTSSIPVQVKSFTNSGIAKDFAPIEKTAQQIRMQEAEKRQQEIMATKKTQGGWLGAKKTEQKPSAPIAFKTSAFVTMAEKNVGGENGPNVKFAPLQQTEKPEKVIQKQQSTFNKPATSGWAASTVQQNGMKFQPIALSEQQKRMNGGRQQQQIICVSKKQIQERKRARQQKEKQQQLLLAKNTSA